MAPKRLNLVVLGARGVGKTSIVSQFLDNQLPGQYCPSIESSWKKSFSFTNKLYECVILDTAGHDSFTLLHPRHIIGTHGYILVYSVESRESFEIIKLLHDKIVEFCGSDTVAAPIVIVGNKVDTGRREVASLEVHDLAAELACPYLEISSHSKTGVHRVFESLIQKMEKNNSHSQRPTLHLEQHAPARSTQAGHPSSLLYSFFSPLVSLHSSTTTTARHIFQPETSPILTTSHRASSLVPINITRRPSGAVYDDGKGSGSATLRNSLSAFMDNLFASRRSGPSWADSAKTFVEPPSPAFQLPSDKSELLTDKDAFVRQVNTFINDLACHRLKEASKDHGWDDATRRLGDLFVSIAEDKDLRKALLELKVVDAQVILNALQLALDTNSAPSFKRSPLLKLLLRLSKSSSSYPQCLILDGVVREDEHAITAGHFGEIWKGRFRGRHVCLKMVKAYQRSHIEHLLKVFSREAILWSQLEHRNVLPFYGIYHLNDDSRRVCLVSPWMEGGCIREYLNGRQGVARYQLAQDVTEGLAYLHSQGIVHGDLKGDNILVGRYGRACLADFGLANLMDGEMLKWTSTESTGLIGGTARWQAPELFDPANELAKATTHSDIYSLGCVFYEIFTGNLPFHDIAREPTVIAHVMAGRRPSKPCRHTNPFLLWGLNDALWRCMDDCWSRKCDDRPSTVRVLALLASLCAPNRRENDDKDWVSPLEFRRAMRCASMNQELGKEQDVSVDRPWVGVKSTDSKRQPSMSGPAGGWLGWFRPSAELVV